ncbi:helicase associated domain-containing protein [Pseudonocardia acidicola]|nr:helicase associated domain-containing protein [Pseudonocardia acidicola]
MINTREAAWERGLNALRRYAAVKGTARVPPGARADGVEVGAWAAAQRAQYWAGALAPQRVALLERLPGWDWSGAHQRKWESRLAALTRYVRAHPTAQVPAGAVIDHVHIGAWAAAQRAAYVAGTLPACNAGLLEALPGWTWATEDRSHV